MRVGFVQFQPRFGDVKGNCEAMVRLISSTVADLLVLPEFATTGYTFASRDELARLAEPFETSESLARLHELAVERSCALVVGFAESAGERFYNSAAFLKPDCTRSVYRKIHLFGTETLFFTPGPGPFEVFTYRGTAVGIIICFDWYFPESIRVLALKGAQIICHPANLVLQWCQCAMVVRSVENRVFTVTANRYGHEANGGYSFTFTGESQVTSPSGEVLAKAPGNVDYVAVVDIDPYQALNKQVTPYNDLFKCRCPDLYGAITESLHDGEC